MEKFSDLIYKRPNYQSQKEKLLQYKKIMLQSWSYEEIRTSWLEMKDFMYRFDFFKVFAYIKYTCGIDMGTVWGITIRGGFEEKGPQRLRYNISGS